MHTYVHTYIHTHIRTYNCCVISGRLLVGDLSGAIIAYHSGTNSTTAESEPQEVDHDEFIDVSIKIIHTYLNTFVHTYIHTCVVYKQLIRGSIDPVVDIVG
jgi:hypothetical protein